MLIYIQECTLKKDLFGSKSIEYIEYFLNQINSTIMKLLSLLCLSTFIAIITCISQSCSKKDDSIKMSTEYLLQVKLDSTQAVVDSLQVALQANQVKFDKEQWLLQQELNDIARQGLESIGTELNRIQKRNRKTIDSLTISIRERSSSMDSATLVRLMQDYPLVREELSK
jgi:hypothetical protein